MFIFWIISDFHENLNQMNRYNPKNIIGTDFHLPTREASSVLLIPIFDDIVINMWQLISAVIPVHQFFCLSYPDVLAYMAFLHSIRVFVYNLFPCQSMLWFSILVWSVMMDLLMTFSESFWCRDLESFWYSSDLVWNNLPIFSIYTFAQLLQGIVYTSSLIHQLHIYP